MYNNLLSAVTLGIGLFMTSLIARSQTSVPPISGSNKDIEACYRLIERVIRGYTGQFKLELITDNGQDVFEIDKSGRQVLLRGNNPVSIAAALHHYLKYECHVHLSWCGHQLNLPKLLPLPQKKFRKQIEQKYRVNFNYCTFNYSASWWDWKRWEQEIDFMALNGINMPLSVVGLEGVWYNTLLRHGLQDEEARSFLVGPAYFAWQWMTNIQSHPRPLPRAWIDKRIELGKKIIARQVELGMTPIQQGFSGYVPRELKNKYPDASILIGKKWCNFPGAAQLDPLDPLFKKIGRTFFEEQQKLFGAHHYYAADPFHEGTPPQEGSEYLNKVGIAISQLMQENDSLSTWIMQAWSIREEIATVIPKEKLLILDLNGSTAGKKENFWGYNFVVGSLHNFGGRINLHGDLRLLASNKQQQLHKKMPNAIGTGYFMEGIIQNPVYYDLAFEMGISSDSLNINDWLKRYATRRYGAASANAYAGWLTLLNTVYKQGTDGVEKSSIICARPAVNVKKSGPNAGFSVPYNNKDLLHALQLLLKDQQQLKGSDAYRYDMVDILRQVLSNHGQVLHKKAAQAFTEKNRADFIKYSQAFLSLLKDVDKLLLTREEFSFKKWVNDARSWGDTEDEKNYYEYNAAMLVTLWGPLTEKDEPFIFDYSWREWSGLIEQYYYKRWELFYQMLDTHLLNNTEYKEGVLPLTHGRESFRANDFYSKLADWEIAWVKKKRVFDHQQKESELNMVKMLVEKYGKEIE
jgi:alpha-N-acetylglucosaminidase